MESLGRLPFTLWPLVLSDSYSHLFLQLWKCGDSTLNRSLARGLTSIHLKDEKTETATRFPSLLLQLPNLRDLTIERGRWRLDVTVASLRENLLRLPTTQLETLHLECAEAKFVFRPFNPEDEATSTQCRSFLESEDDDPEYECEPGEGKAPAEDLLDLKSLFPNLRTLGLIKVQKEDTQYGYIDSFLQTIYEEDLAKLPRSLTKLSSSFFEVTSANQQVFKKLPRSLLIWDVAFSNGTLMQNRRGKHGGKYNPERLWATPPPDLHTVAHYSVSTDDRQTTFNYLPRTLQTISIDSNGEWSPARLRSLPPGLLSLSMSSLDKEELAAVEPHWLKLVPSNLTSLNLCYNSISNVALLANLPRTLTELMSQARAPDMEYAELRKEIEESNGTFWPPGLVTLDLADVMLATSDIDLLPRTLLRFIGKCLLRAEFPGEKLPPNLIDLELHPMSFGAYDFRFTLPLPQSIAKMVLHLRNVSLTLVTDGIPAHTKVEIF